MIQDPESATPDGRPTAALRPRRRLPLVWLVPIVTLAIAAWLVWDTYASRGPTITLTFQTAEGLQAGQSQLKFKNVTMGTVQSIALSPDHSRVIVRVQTVRAAAPLLTEKTLFWVVKPRLFAGSISGLDTLLSGSYIQMLPPAKPGVPHARHFTGLEDPPVLQADIPGTTFLVHADSIGSISLGSPVFYRDFTVGEVLGWDVGDMARNVTIHVFVRAPYDKYVRDDSHFWNASGASIDLTASGIKLQLESLRALLLGGIAFDTPEGGAAAAAPAGHEFNLFADREAAHAALYGEHLNFVALFKGSVRGLAPGADVTLHGLKIGQVTGINLRYDPATDSIVAPVTFDVDPGRISNVRHGTAEEVTARLQQLVARGLRASLQSSNLLTGQKLVALDFYPDAPKATLGVQRDAYGVQGDVYVAPTYEAGGFDSITASAGQLLSRLNTIPFAQIGDNLASLTKGAADLVNGDQVKSAVGSLQTTLAEVQDVVAKLDKGATPALKRLPAIADDLQRTLAQAQRLIGSIDVGYGANSDMYRNLDRLLVQLNDTTRSLRMLSDMLTRHPEALIRGRADQGGP
jgi:paraquat-inducible protein B